MTSCGECWRPPQSAQTVQFQRLAANYRGGSVRGLIRTVLFTSAMDRHRRAAVRKEEPLDRRSTIDRESCATTSAESDTGALADLAPSAEMQLVAAEHRRMLDQAIAAWLDARAARIQLGTTKSCRPETGRRPALAKLGQRELGGVLSSSEPHARSRSCSYDRYGRRQRVLLGRARAPRGVHESAGRAV